MKISKSPLRLYPSSKAVIANFLSLPGKNRVSNIIERVKKLSDEETEICLNQTMADFADRHRNIEAIFFDHFYRINALHKDDLSIFSERKKLLLGAFFTKEYSIQAAALFNPSIVSHPDQGDIRPGEQRFIMSLRATGEGHISSIVFQTGIVDHLANIALDETARYHTCVKKNEYASYSRDFLQQRLAMLPGYEEELLQKLPANFTTAEATRILNESGLCQQESAAEFCRQLYKELDSNYELEPSSNLPLNEKVIFPIAKSECMGMEDVRFVKFEKGGKACYYGTYTAYNGKEIKTQLIETTDFNIFKIRTLYGTAISDKGMALFPEKVNGKYVMISRQGGELINIMYSEDLYFWDSYQLLMEPLYTWELVQLGNCGAPLKTAKGWLLLTHGVGVMRTYVISAILLDLNDPSKIVGRLNKPLIIADESEREGYVPNVVYTCGLLRHGNMLIIPYAVSDSATGFVTLELEELLFEMRL